MMLARATPAIALRPGARAVPLLPKGPLASPLARGGLRVHPSLTAIPDVKAAGIFGLGGPSTPPPEELPDSPEQIQLRATAGAQRTLSAVAFWLQLALSLASAFILIFSVAFTPQGATRGGDVSKYFAAAGIVTALLSTFFAHGFKRLANKLIDGGVVSQAWLVANALRNNALNLLGIGLTTIGLQASVGTLVAKSLTTAVQSPYAVAPGASAVVSLDVFALQASTNVLLSHVVSLLFINLLLGVINKPAPVPPITGGAAAVIPSEVDA